LCQQLGFIALTLADPGSISVIRAGSSFITALLLLVLLKR
jgi:hypothetical protein